MAPTVLIVDGNEGVQTRIHAWLLGAGVQHTQVFDGEVHDEAHPSYSPTTSMPSLPVLNSVMM